MTLHPVQLSDSFQPFLHFATMSSNSPNTTTTHDVWRRLPDVPVNGAGSNYFGKTISFDDNEYILVMQDPKIKEIKFAKYNAIRNDWTDLGTYQSSSQRVHDYFYSSDPCTNKLFVFDTDLNTVNTLDLTTNQLVTLNTVHSEELDVGDHSYQRSIVSNGLCHYFMLFECDDMNEHGDTVPGKPWYKHCVLDEESGKLVVKFEIRANMTFTQIHGRPLYVSKLDCLLLIQTQGWRLKGDIWRYWMNKDDNRISGYDNVSRFYGDWLEESSNKLEKVKGVQIPFYPKTVSLNFDERYVVMSNRRDIYLLDISDEEHFKLFKSDIRTPFASKLDDNGDLEKYLRNSSLHKYDTMIRIGSGLNNEKLVIGWTRKLFAKDVFQDLSLPPLYLLQMIANWISVEELHLIHRRQHYVIPMKRILASTLTIIDGDES